MEVHLTRSAEARARNEEGERPTWRFPLISSVPPGEYFLQILSNSSADKPLAWAAVHLPVCGDRRGASRLVGTKTTVAAAHLG
jgi:hypothetical protein